MLAPRLRVLLLAPWLLLVLPAVACASSGEEAPAETDDASILTGRVTREEIEAAHPEWVTATVRAEIDAAAAQALTAVEPGAHVSVYFGSWCSDSRREVPRLWRALDEVGWLVPFEIEHVGVDRSKEEPADLVAGQDLHYVPTVVVRRGGEEVGRIVEISPNGIERDLLALLTGAASGILTAREDLPE